MMDKKLKNSFVRILKDIGLYTEWLKARKKASKPIPLKLLQNEGSLNAFILSSILWTDSDYPSLWSCLYTSAPSSYTAKYIIEKNKINELKKIIEKHMKQINK